MQENLSVIPKGTHGSKEFSFTRLFSCGACGAGITAEEKVKRLKDGTVKRYVYYHCTKQVDRNCRESFLREESLIEQLLKIVDKLSIDELGMAEIVKAEMENFNGSLWSCPSWIRTSKTSWFFRNWTYEPARN